MEQWNNRGYMLRLPLSLERRLEKLLPRAKDRERFIVEAVQSALDHEELALGKSTPAAIGGTLHLYTDGGSRGNPGEAALGCVLIDPTSGKVLREHQETLGVQTNNVAEYRALIAGLEMARAFHPNRLVCHLDSELIVKQLTGEYRVKVPSLQPFVEEIQTLAEVFPKISFHHIPREANRLADALVNRALDAKGI